MAISREEQLRNNRRFSRQIVGAVAIVLIIIGLFTVLSWVVGVLRSALDDTERRQSYADRLYGLVMFDTMPFDDVSKVDQSEFLQAAIWGAVYQIQKRDNGLSDYERDSETGSIILPKLEVDTYLTNLLGPDYKITDGSFQTEEFNYTYDEEKQGYLVPVTSMVAMYTPEVEKISTQSGKTYVTVGYIPTINNSSSGEINLTAPTEPTKYMDYVFTRGEGRKWYLSALQESDMQPEVSASTAAPTTDSGDPRSWCRTTWIPPWPIPAIPQVIPPTAPLNRTARRTTRPMPRANLKLIPGIPVGIRRIVQVRNKLLLTKR